MHRLLLAAALLAAVVLQPGRPTVLDTPCGKMVLRALPAAPLPDAAPTGYVLALQPPPGARLEASVEAPPGTPPTPLVPRNGLLETPYPLPYGSDALLVLKCGPRTLTLRVRASPPPSPGAEAPTGAPRTFTPPEPAADYPFGISKAYRKVFGRGAAANRTEANGSAGTAAASSSASSRTLPRPGGYRVTPLRVAAAALLAASLAELLLSQRRSGHTYGA